MKIIRITERPTTLKERWLYHLLDHFGTFSLLECRNRDSLCLQDITHTLVLDHFDEAKNQPAILRQVLNESSAIQALVLVGGVAEFRIEESTEYECDLHIVFGNEYAHPDHVKVTHVYDLGVAVSLIKNSLMRAA